MADNSSLYIDSISFREVPAVSTVVARYGYDAFGNIVRMTGNEDNSITYAGYQFDWESGLYYINSRYYDSKTVRFSTENVLRGQVGDPLSLNVYTYCVNNPLIYWDPIGYIPEGLDDQIGDTLQILKLLRNGFLII